MDSCCGLSIMPMEMSVLARDGCLNLMGSRLVTRFPFGSSGQFTINLVRMMPLGVHAFVPLVTLFDHRKDSLRNGLGFEHWISQNVSCSRGRTTVRNMKGVAVGFLSRPLGQLFAGDYVSIKKQVINYADSLR